jgi:hypothetical protein
MNFLQTVNALHNRIVQMERNQQHNRFPPRNGYQGPPLNQIPPTMLEPTNMFDHEPPHYCRACESFHEEKTCAKYIEMVKAKCSR